MEKTLLVYVSKTGFTKKYVDWLNERITCKTVPLKKIEESDLHSFEVIIYGGGIRAGRIYGLKQFRKKTKSIQGSARIIVFATGAAPYDSTIVSNLKSENFSDEELKTTPFFYFQSGLNYEKMSYGSRLLLKIYGKILDAKKNKSNIESETSSAISHSYDYTDQEYLNPLVDYLNAYFTH